MRKSNQVQRLLVIVMLFVGGVVAVRAASSSNVNACMPAVSSPQYTVTDLGSVGVVMQLGYTPGLSLNEKGGVAWHMEDAKQAFLWTKGKKMLLGDMHTVAARSDGTIVGLRVPDPAHVGHNKLCTTQFCGTTGSSAIWGYRACW